MASENVVFENLENMHTDFSFDNHIENTVKGVLWKKRWSCTWLNTSQVTSSYSNRQHNIISTRNSLILFASSLSSLCLSNHTGEGQDLCEAIKQPREALQISPSAGQVAGVEIQLRDHKYSKLFVFSLTIYIYIYIGHATNEFFPLLNRQHDVYAVFVWHTLYLDLKALDLSLDT